MIFSVGRRFETLSHSLTFSLDLSRGALCSARGRVRLSLQVFLFSVALGPTVVVAVIDVVGGLPPDNNVQFHAFSKNLFHAKTIFRSSTRPNNKFKLHAFRETLFRLHNDISAPLSQNLICPLDTKSWFSLTVRATMFVAHCWISSFRTSSGWWRWLL